MAGVKIIHVPYKGAAPQLADLAGKQSHDVRQHRRRETFHRRRRIRPIARHVRDARAALPDVPDCGVSAARRLELVNFFGFLGPAGMPTRF